jgi:hypothetical protein
MSQMSQLIRNEDRLSVKADIPHEAVEFVDMSELVDQACHIHKDPYELLAAVQSSMHDIWKVQAKLPNVRCKPFYQWYLEQTLPRSVTDKI